MQSANEPQSRHEPTASRSSIMGLDLLTFLMADVRGGDDNDPRTEAGRSGRAIPIPELFKKRDLIIFLISVVLFHFGNAAMLPMAGQVLAKTHRGADIVALSACIITAQLVMIGIAAMVGWAIRRGIPMKKSKKETAETRQRIVKTGAAEFRRIGINGIGLSDLTAAAGLTHGSFYRHSL